MNAKKNLVNATAFGLIKRLKTVMKWAQSKGLADNVDLSEFKAPEKESINAVALTEAELDAIERLDLHPTESLYKVRDTFLLQCYTGLRYSDIQNLKRENLKESEIVITTKKTSDPIIIPIHTRLKNLLDRYPDFVFPTMSNQKMNAYIKIICARAEINEPVQIVKFYGKERKEERVPKHQIISTHTARRTFITLSLKKSILPEMVMKISGHKDRKSFQKYVKIAQNEAVESVREAWKK
jgi:integrase